MEVTSRKSGEAKICLPAKAQLAATATEHVFVVLTVNGPNLRAPYLWYKSAQHSISASKIRRRGRKKM